jgi:hypothetical protein
MKRAVATPPARCHVWSPPAPARASTCERCGARCFRDSAGKIVLFAVADEFSLPMEAL